MCNLYSISSVDLLFPIRFYFFVPISCETTTYNRSLQSNVCVSECAWDNNKMNCCESMAIVRPCKMRENRTCKRIKWDFECFLAIVCHLIQYIPASSNLSIQQMVWLSTNYANINVHSIFAVELLAEYSISNMQYIQMDDKSADSSLGCRVHLIH